MIVTKNTLLTFFINYTTSYNSVNVIRVNNIWNVFNWLLSQYNSGMTMAGYVHISSAADGMC